MASNKVKFGLSNVHYAPMTVADDGSVSFETPKPWPGAVSLSWDAQGDTEKFYADDTQYYVSTANNGYQGDLESALVPDSFRQDVLNEQLDETAKVLMEWSNVESKPFALLYQVRGDQGPIRGVYYNCSATRPTEKCNTISNTKTPDTDTLSITASAMENGLVKAKTTGNTPQATYDNWFKQVWQPTASVE